MTLHAQDGNKTNQTVQYDSIGAYPYYCKGSKVFVIKKQQNGLYEISVQEGNKEPAASKQNLSKRDTLPTGGNGTKDKADSPKDEAVPSGVFYSTALLDNNGFAAWIKDRVSDCDDKAVGVIYVQLQNLINQHANGSIMTAHRKEVDSLAQLLQDKDRVAGELKLSKSVPVYAFTKWVVKRTDIGRILRLGLSVYKKDSSFIESKLQIGLLKITKARVQLDNNRIQDISFDSDFYDTSGQRKIRTMNTISNNDYSLSFMSLNKRSFTHWIDSSEYKEAPLAKGFWFNYADLINYSPRNGDFTPVVTNNNYQLSTDSAVAVYRRRYSEYLSFRTFLDPLGFLGNNPNGFAQLEGDALLPVRLTSYKSVTWLAHLHTNFSYIYSNTINAEPRLANTQLFANDTFNIFDPIAQGFVRKNDTSNYINNLDIVRKAYYQLYMRVAIFSIETKRQNSWIHFELGARVLGARVSARRDTTAASSFDTSTYHKFIPEINIKWVLRPDNLFGADLNLGLAYLGNVHRANNRPQNLYKSSFLWANAWAIPHELNVYILTGRGSNGGLFFRYNGWICFSRRLARNIDERLIPDVAGFRKAKTGYFPQILIGYSTNLSTMVKRSNKEF